MLKRILGALAVSAIVTAAPVSAQDAAPALAPAPAPAPSAAPVPAAAPIAATPSLAPETVLTSVNGVAITAGDVAYASTTLGEAVERVPADQRDEMILSLLIDMQLMAGAADKAGLGDSADFRKRLEFVRMQSLQEEYMRRLVDAKITDEAVAARYQQEAGKLPEREQISASHILVDDEAKAKELIAQINGGADFGELATANSKDPGSAAQGGALGFFSQGQMVPEFETAAFALEKGAITAEPVRSQFGWHVIRLDDKRELPVPPLEQVADQIRQVMVRETYIAEIETLKQGATIVPAAASVAPAGGAGTDGQAPAQ